MKCQRQDWRGTCRKLLPPPPLRFWFQPFPDGSGRGVAPSPLRTLWDLESWLGIEELPAESQHLLSLLCSLLGHMWSLGSSAAQTEMASQKAGGGDRSVGDPRPQTPLQPHQVWGGGQGQHRGMCRHSRGPRQGRAGQRQGNKEGWEGPLPPGHPAQLGEGLSFGLGRGT